MGSDPFSLGVWGFAPDFVKIASALWALPPYPFGSGVWGSTPDSCLLLLYTNTTFYKAIVLVIKPFIDVEKEQSAPLFLFKLCTFCWWKRKNIIYEGYPSYTNDCV